MRRDLARRTEIVLVNKFRVTILGDDGSDTWEIAGGDTG
jgi:hypothetical protein